MRRLSFNLLFIFQIIVGSSYGQSVYSESVEEAKVSFLAKNYVKAAKLYSKAFYSDNNLVRTIDRYEAARCWALGGEIDSAFFQLNGCAKGNYNQYLKIFTDVALISLRNDRRWGDVLQRVKENRNRIVYADSSLKTFNKSLASLLETLYIADQLYRMQIEEVELRYGQTSKQMSEHYKLMATNDSLNLVKLKDIFNTYGWLGEKEVGQQGVHTQFLVIQHADLASQIEYLPLVRNAVKESEIKASSLALLEDRIAARQNRKQVYGTQLRLNSNTGKYYVLPLEDPENVDIRRAKLGLSPLRDYVSQWGIIWSIKQYEEDLAAHKY